MERILAIFAHPDDEAFCVGTMANHSDAGDAVKILWLSKGERTSALDMEMSGKIAARMEQADRIGKLLGVETQFLDFPDAAIEETRENALLVAEEIRKWKPTAIVTWSPLRPVGPGHPDHRHTHTIVVDAVSYARYRFDEGQEVHRLPVSIYLTWDRHSVYPLRLIDVSAQEERIREFFSIYTGMYGRWPVEEMTFSYLIQHGLTASCRLAEAFHFIQLGKADRLLL